MVERPLFSIIVPTFNVEITLSDTIKSVIRQTFTDFEILVVDSLSTDKTIQIAENFNDSRIKIISEKDRGIYDGMNKGIDHSIGEWIYFLGGDDELIDEQVLNDVAKQTSGKEDVIYGNVVSERFNGPYDGLFSKEKLYKRNICHQAIFFRRNLFEKTGLFDLKYETYSDWDHNIKWFLDDSLQKSFINRLIAHYADNGYSSRTDDSAFRKEKAEKFLHFGSSKLNRDLRRTIYLDLAIDCKKTGNYIGFFFFKWKSWINGIYA